MGYLSLGMVPKCGYHGHDRILRIIWCAPSMLMGIRDRTKFKDIGLRQMTPWTFWIGSNVLRWCLTHLFSHAVHLLTSTVDSLFNMSRLPLFLTSSTTRSLVLAIVVFLLDIATCLYHSVCCHLPLPTLVSNATYIHLF